MEELTKERKSNCCNEEIKEDSDVCSKCGEHCDILECEKETKEFAVKFTAEKIVRVQAENEEEAREEAERRFGGGYVDWEIEAKEQR